MVSVWVDNTQNSHKHSPKIQSNYHNSKRVRFPSAQKDFKFPKLEFTLLIGNTNKLIIWDRLCSEESHSLCIILGMSVKMKRIVDKLCDSWLIILCGSDLSF